MRAFQDDTIAAIATPPGEGGIAVIRISGPESVSIANRIFSGNVASYKSHSAHFGRIRDCNGQIVDEVLLIPMRAPRSYTGEDTVEIQCHGGRLITKRVFEVVLQAGARASGPGEFTQRAFLNGKLDLAQAEAVQALIGAKNRRALKAAKEQLEGALSKNVKRLQTSLTEIAAIIDAWVDYPEEGLEFASTEEIIAQLKTIQEKIALFQKSFRDGKIYREGPSLCLLGAPNVGKSSLMNALLGKERAIVTEIAGTTRDLLEESLLIDQLHFKLTDTAGIREAEEIVEKEGIRRSHKAAEEADLLLFILDASRSLSEEESALIAKLDPAKTLAVFNKTDLPHSLPKLNLTTVAISAKQEEGIDRLKKAIQEKIVGNHAAEEHEVTVTEERHFQALSEACAYLDAVIVGLETGLSAEFVAIDLKAALYALGKIVGTNVTEDILSAIFSKFCVGK